MFVKYKKIFFFWNSNNVWDISIMSENWKYINMILQYIYFINYHKKN